MQKVDTALRVVGNILLVLLGAYIAWVGGVMSGVYGIGFLFLPIFPLFILPPLVLTNPRLPWILPLALGTLLFTGGVGAAIRYKLHPHWKQFGNTEENLMAGLWQTLGLVAGVTFGIALLIILLCLGVRRWMQR